MQTSTLFTGLTLIDQGSVHNGKRINLLVNNKGAFITSNSKASDKTTKVIQAKNLYLSKGFTDLRFSLPDPGFEYRENFESAEKLAIASGFKQLCCLPDTNPIIQNKSEVDYFVKRSALSLVDFLPVGAITKGLKSGELSEMFDMKNAGAVAFCNANNAIEDSGVMLRSLLYNRTFNGLLYSFPYDSKLSPGGMMHEGRFSTLLGLKGLPPMAEYLMVKRDLELIKYTEHNIHFSRITTAESVDLIRQAKKEGLKVTADVPLLNLVFTDEALQSFDTNLKLNPPLRDEKHRKALVKGLKDGTIDAICSDHRPLDTEVKEVEFMYADYGASTLQAFFPVIINALQKEIALDKVISLISSNPENILGIKSEGVKKDEIKDFVIWDIETEWELTSENNLSLSENNPFYNKTLKGKVHWFFNKGKLISNN
jgi:dihydroorotase